jgi:alpha,alpha-trehalase
MRFEIAALLLFLFATPQATVREDLKPLSNDVSSAFAKLEPQTIRPAEGYLKYDYLIPGGYYKQMWDWDGFFIGSHLAHQSGERAKYLKWWVLNFGDEVNADGWVPGVVMADQRPVPKPNPVMGMFAVKPFLAQGAVIASERLGDYTWVSPVWEQLRRVQAYREETQYDPKSGLFYWESAMQSGEDNNVALTNEPKDRNAILAVDLCAFQLREYEAMARLAEKVRPSDEANEYRQKASMLRAAMRKHLWFPRDEIFFNVRRDTGEPVRRISGSNFIPLIDDDLLTPEEARATIRRYLLNPEYMLAPYGIRSLSKQDPSYNNVSMITPYSNWQGPVWINTNYLYFLALRRYGFDNEAAKLSGILGRMLLADIRKWGSMHECYDAETGEGLAPTAAQSKEHKFPGFVGWDLLVEDMLQCEVIGDCMTFAWNGAGGARTK